MGIIAEIYEGKYGRDKLSVLPEYVTEVCVVNAEGPFEPSELCPAVRIVPANGGPGACRAVPVEAADAGKWLMKGYSFIHSSDSRFSECAGKACGTGRFYGAVALHDRFEP